MHEKPLLIVPGVRKPLRSMSRGLYRLLSSKWFDATDQGGWRAYPSARCPDTSAGVPHREHGLDSDPGVERPAECPPFETALVPMARLSRCCTDAIAAANHLVAAFAYGPATSRRPRRLTVGQTSRVPCRWPWTTGLV